MRGKLEKKKAGPLVNYWSLLTYLLTLLESHFCEARTCGGWLLSGEAARLLLEVDDLRSRLAFSLLTWPHQQFFFSLCTLKSALNIREEEVCLGAHIRLLELSSATRGYSQEVCIGIGWWGVEELWFFWSDPKKYMFIQWFPPIHNNKKQQSKVSYLAQLKKKSP